MPKGDEYRKNYQSFEYFSEHRVDMAQEVKLHPELIERLQYHKQDDFFMMLAEVAVYCNVILDGTYEPHEIDHLCKLLREKLVSKRTGILFAREVVKH